MNELNNLVRKCKKLLSNYDITWKESFLQWNLPSQIKADLALKFALSLANIQKIHPHEVAQQAIKFIDYPHWKWNITPDGYINANLPLNYYKNFLKNTYLKQGKNLAGRKKKKKINIEYVSANPTGYLHLAHFRQAFIGNALANVYEFMGYKVTREYYINDRGGQINSLIDSVNYFYHQLQGFSSPNAEKAQYSGNSSQETARYLVKKWGRKYINKELNEGELTIWKKAISEKILTKIKQDLKKSGIKIKKWSSESNLYLKNRPKKLLDNLAKKGLTYNQEGAIFLRTSLKKGDDKDRVLIKQNGDYTYFFSDILYHQNKLKRADKLINIFGADHHGFIPRLKSACELLGYSSKKIQFILIQMLSILISEGKTAKFSKRAGNAIELKEALAYIGLDQLKYLLLEKDSNQSLNINISVLKENKKKTPLYYLQYSHARCHQIFKKAKQKKINIISLDINLLSHESEKKILNLLIRFPLTLESIIKDNKIQSLIHYLHELAQAWQNYYQNVNILDLAKPELTHQKLLLVKNIQLILYRGLKLLGIKVLKNM